MERCRFIFSLLIIFSGWIVNANSAGTAVSCSGILNAQSKSYIIGEAGKIKSPETLYSINLKSDQRFNQTEVSKESLVDLFSMLGQTQFFNSSEKITLEKGKLYLGRKIDSQFSVEGEYVYDQPNKVLHLIRISLINSKNGQEQVLTKEPLDYSGQDFLKQNYNIVLEKGSALAKVTLDSDIKPLEQDLETQPLIDGQKLVSLKTENVHLAEVSFPPSISKTSFDKINKWAHFVPYLRHTEISVVDSVNKQRWAIAKGQFRRVGDFVKDRFLKQAVGLFVVYAIFEGASGFSKDIAKYAIEIIQSQNATVSVKVKETLVNGQVTDTEQKFKINLPKKDASNGDKSSGGTP